MLNFGIIGNPLRHSFSAKFFNKKFENEHIDAHYQLYSLESIEQFPALCREHSFTGLNVTLPYKETVIPYLDKLDDTAEQIGAVNVIHFSNNCLIGYNTDTLGFMHSISPLLQPHHTHALVLGTGGAAKAVHYGLMRLGVECQYVSRDSRKGITYEQLNKDIVNSHLVVVNCTPLGMYPETEACAPFPYQYLTTQHLAYDVIYNPEQTLFLKKAAAQGATTCNGIGMLQGQARAAWEIWNA